MLSVYIRLDWIGMLYFVVTKSEKNQINEWIMQVRAHIN